MKTPHFLLLVFLMACAACTHKAEEKPFLGPAITPEDFSVQDGSFQATFPQVNFQNEAQSFKALFSSTVKWFIAIKGLESGAVKKLSGISAALDVASTSWYGTSDSVFFFKTGEECLATLTFSGSDLVLHTSFLILSEKKYEGVLVDDFEKMTSDKLGFDTTYTDPADADIVFAFDDSSTKVQGTRSLLMEGLDADSNYWIGGVQTAPLALHGLFGQLNPSTVYFNVSLYGTGANDAGLSVKLYEDDDGSGAYEPTSDDAFSYLIKVDWKGWKRVYVPYSSFSDDNVSIGNNTAEASNWKSLNLALVAFSTTQKVSLHADYLLISTGSPLPHSELK